MYLLLQWRGDFEMCFSFYRLVFPLETFVLLPPIWFVFSMPIELGLNRIPVVKVITILSNPCSFTLHSVFSGGWTAKNGHSPILHLKLPKLSQLPKTKRIFEIQRGKPEIVQFILSDKCMDRPGQGLRHFFAKNVPGNTVISKLGLYSLQRWLS